MLRVVINVRSVKGGVPMSIHYAFAALALAVGTLGAQEAPTIKRAPPENISAAKGPEMFMAYCSVCHGKDGQGGGPAAASLRKRPADLTQLSRRNGGKYPTARVENVIQGDTASGPHGSRDMPIWGNVFLSIGKPEIVRLRIANLAAYIESLQAK